MGGGDIEDLARAQQVDADGRSDGDGDDDNDGRPGARELLMPAPARGRRRGPAGSGDGGVAQEDLDLDAAADEAVGTVPGTARVWIRTMGCSHNVADSEVMAGVLLAQGYRVAMEGQRGAAAAKEAADVWLLNSCTVKDPSEMAVGGVLREAAARGKAVVVAGCVPQGERGARVLQAPFPPPLPPAAGGGGSGGPPAPAPPPPRPIAVGLVGVAQLGRVAEVVEAVVRGESLALLGRGRGERALPSAELPQARRNPRVAVVPLSQGCLGACTYCKTVHARGALSSYAPEAVEARVLRAARDPHVREIHLSSEDVGAYGRDRGTSLAALLARLTAALDAAADEHGQLEPSPEEGGGLIGPVEGAYASSDSDSGSDGEDGKDGDGDGDGDGERRRPDEAAGGPRPPRPRERRRRLHRVRLRVGMSNPPFLLRDGALDPVARALRHPAVYRWLHLPVQSGDDGVLRRMNREYTVADFEACVAGLRARVRGLAIATDIIVGFPGEDGAAFEATLDLLRRHRFPSAHCTKFYPRPGTPAARYRPRVPTAVQKARTAAAAFIIDGRDLAPEGAEAGGGAGGAAASLLPYSPYRAMVGTVQRVVVVDVASDGVSLVAHARNHAQVLLPPAPGLMGAVADARVLSASRWSVKGEVVRVLYAPPAAAGAAGAGEREGGAGEGERQEGQEGAAGAADGGDAAAARAASAARARVRAARRERAAAAAGAAAAAAAAAQAAKAAAAVGESAMSPKQQQQEQQRHEEGLPSLPSTPPKKAGGSSTPLPHSPAAVVLPPPPSSSSPPAIAPPSSSTSPFPTSSRLASLLISAGTLLLVIALLLLGGATTLSDAAATLAGRRAGTGLE